MRAFQLAFNFIEPPPPLTQADMERLHIRLLEESLHHLADGRACEESRQEVMQWVEEEGIWPFSFDLCCSLAGVSPQRTREAVKALLERRQNDD